MANVPAFMCRKTRMEDWSKLKRCYIVSYDLVDPKNYDALRESIMSYDGWAHIADSTWAVVTGKSAADVRNDLAKSLDADDLLFVVKSGTEAAWQNVKCHNRWLKEYL